MFFCKGPFWSEGKLRGSVLFVVIGAIIVMSVVGAALARLHGSGTETEAHGNNVDEVYYAAISGLNYANARIAKVNAGTETGGWTISDLPGTYVIDSNRKFIITEVSKDSTTRTITSQGVMTTSSGKGFNYIISADITYSPPSNLGEYNFLNPSARTDYAAYATNLTRDIPTGLDNAQVTTNNLTVGKDYNYGFGNVWYTGTKAGVSTKGVSAFGTGFRLFFTFKFATNVGDGFVVAILNAAQNNYLSCGGDSAEGGLLGYAGDSRVYNSKDGTFATSVAEYVDTSGFTKGLNPPKFGIEVDTYTNADGSDSWKPSAAKADCASDNGFMNDSSSLGDHIGIMFWGTNDAYLRKTCYGPGSKFEGNLKRYGDVRHGLGSNASNSSSWNNALKYKNFSVGTTYYLRMDVVKTGTSVKVTSWVASCKGTSSAASCANQMYGTNTSNHKGTLSDTLNDFSDTSKLSNFDFVSVTDTQVLTSAENTAFTNFIWGFTSGSGDATQQIDFRNIGLSLR